MFDVGSPPLRPMSDADQAGEGPREKVRRGVVAAKKRMASTRTSICRLCDAVC